MKGRIVLLALVASIALASGAIGCVIQEDKSGEDEKPPRSLDTLPPDVAAFCSATTQMFQKVKVAGDYYEANIRNKARITNAERERFRNLMSEANKVISPLPTPEAPGTKLLYDLVRDYQAANDRFVSGVYAESNPELRSASDQAIAARGGLDSARRQLC